MTRLLGLIKSIICAVLLSDVTRSALAAAFARSARRIAEPAVISKIILYAAALFGSGAGGRSPGFIKTLAQGLLALTVLGSMKRSSIGRQALISAIAALLVALMRTDGHGQGRGSRSKTQSGLQGEQVIDIDDYTVVEER